MSFNSRKTRYTLRASLIDPLFKSTLLIFLLRIFLVKLLARSEINHLPLRNTSLDTLILKNRACNLENSYLGSISPLTTSLSTTARFCFFFCRSLVSSNWKENESTKNFAWKTRVLLLLPHLFWNLWRRYEENIEF